MQAAPYATPVARAGETCWRIERADRAAVLIDAQEYFAAVRAVLEKARHSILLLGWDFDPRTDLAPDAKNAVPDREIGALLQSLVTSRPHLHVNILIWDMVLPISILHLGYPQRSRAWFGGNIEFELDGVHPSGGCHHQKVLVVDDAVAFCGGTDIATDRWDTVEHQDGDPRRRLPSGRPHPPRHDLMMMVDGAAARALGDLARARWHRATGNQLEAAPSPHPDLWPEPCAPAFTHVDVAVARTAPAHAGTPAISENFGLHVESIAAARELIYLENQYLVSREIERALMQRLAQPDGPEIVVICGSQSPSYFDRLAIDGAQHALLAALAEADRFGRFRAYTPLTAGGEPIIVHSKASIIDARLLRIGSTNLNNRSLGFDTECDLAIDANAQRAIVATTKQAIATTRERMLAHHLNVDATAFSAAVRRERSFITAIESFASRRLRPARASAIDADESPLRSLIAEYHLGDPQSVDDVWRPWKRG